MEDSVGPFMHHYSAIVLAAGKSSRMGIDNKLLLPFKDKTVLASVVEAVCSSPVEDVIVVTGHQDRQIRDVLASYRVRIAYNPEFEGGMSTSIRRGVLASSADTYGFVICLGDMPFISDLTISRLVRLFDSEEQPSIAVTTVEGKRGHPVLFHCSYRDALMGLTGDVGAKSVVEANADRVVEVEVRDQHALADIDTWDGYTAARAL